MAGVDTLGHHSLPLLRLPRRLFASHRLMVNFHYCVFTGLWLSLPLESAPAITETHSESACSITRLLGRTQESMCFSYGITQWGIEPQSSVSGGSWLPLCETNACDRTLTGQYHANAHAAEWIWEFSSRNNFLHLKIWGEWRGSNSYFLVHSEMCRPLHYRHHSNRVTPNDWVFTSSFWSKSISFVADDEATIRNHPIRLTTA